MRLSRAVVVPHGRSNAHRPGRLFMRARRERISAEQPVDVPKIAAIGRGANLEKCSPSAKLPRSG
jgi:hypothetical protein